ncbi:SLC13 family permease [Rhodobacter veldkampii DSM 11550]|uniref:SLC13 family permease n=1 Tax=Phaeovulum veldkampii DSM 11550 TaxID=1185920 RepID=A0A2T4JID4_9RHOB|nr:SLC13 family permease [Phaeovulum veldkampii]MBK5946977.1 SLC13 family permease [Phaeovulum veldkampii DSM 11550]PTE17664.1 SLC13 family permease [Phaeovulum veldkampii DSM 11550]TDQ57504.1 di/tricarboxylate transporter [Phaeovulum veldkampii DSM 11550]
MTQDQGLITAILVATVALFLWGRFRHDMVALAALLAATLVGLVPGSAAFAGFGHPAVITVACVLVLSRGLQTTGAVDILARRLLPATAGRTVSLAALMGLGAALSGFMNNVGAMALLMPVAVQLAGRLDLTPGQVLMPLAFGTILGGMTTLVGTPPNLIVAGFRAEAGGTAFGMFDFTPVGLAVAVAGVAFVALLGWRLVPARRPAGREEFETGAYLTEVRVPEKSRASGMRLAHLENELEGAGAQVVGLVRNDVRISAPRGSRMILTGDILLLEAEAEGLGEALAKLGLTLGEQGSSSKGAPDTEAASRDEIVLREYVVRAESNLVGRSAKDMALRTRYGLNLLAVSREGRRSQARLRTMRLQSGDLLLMQGPAEVLADFSSENNCVPLAERELRLPDRRQAALAAVIMVGAVGLAAFGILPAAVAFALGVLVSMVARTVPPTSVYTAIDWPVIVLLAALIPVAGAMQTTGAAELLARFLVDTVAQGQPVVALAVVLVVTMFLSDVMNNAATAAVMCPIALGIAGALGVNPDSFLMAVAIGASCAFLTPIGHQNNTLILGPGGFGFGDYWRLGLPLEALVVVVSLPLLLWVWPL